MPVGQGVSVNVNHLSCKLLNTCLENPDILYRAVCAVRFCYFNIVHYFHTFGYFTEYGIRTVQVGSAAYGAVCFDLFGGEAEFLFFVRQLTGLGFQGVL